MLFGRRDKPSISERVRVFVWPRRNWMRSGKYFVKRILRLSGSPYMIAAGVAAGVFTSFTPFLGLHFVISWAIAFAIGGNMLAAAIGTGVGNPITFPFIWGSTYTTGCFLLGKEAQHGELSQLKDGLFGESFATIWPTIKVMTIGALPIGLIFAFIFYYVTRKAALVYQNRRKAILARKAFEEGRWRKAIAEHDLAQGSAESA